MVVVTLRVSVTLEMRAKVMDLFSSFVGPVSVQPGCLAVRLYSQSMPPYDFLLVEEWESQRLLQKHIRSDDFQNILGIIDLGNKSPDIQFHKVSSVKGLELIKELRGRDQIPSF